MKIIPLFRPFIALEIRNEIWKTLQSGCITQGPKCDELELALSKRLKNEGVLLTNSCTAAITVAYRLIQDDLLEKDPFLIHPETICSPLNCLASHSPIPENFVIKWADIDRQNLLIDLEEVRKKLTPRTRVLHFVSYGGIPVDYNKLQELMEYYRREFGKGLYVIEDAAHSIGASWDNILVGQNQSIFTAFSFGPIKSLSGAGGSLCCLPEFYEKAKLLRWHGFSRDKGGFRSNQDVSYIGFRANSNDIEATIGLCNLKHLDKIIAWQRDCAEFYSRELPEQCVQLQIDKKCKPAWWLYNIILPTKKERDDLQKFLLKKGIETHPVHARNDRYSCFEKFRTYLPMMDNVDQRRLCLPTHYDLSERDRGKVIQEIRKFYRN